MAFEDFESRDLISGISNSISSVIDEIEERKESGNYTIEDFKSDIENNEFHILKFTETPEIFFEAIDIRIRRPIDSDSNIPNQLATGRHKPMTLVIEVDTVDESIGTLVTNNISVVAKPLTQRQGVSEIFGYKNIGNLPHLEVLAVLGSEFEDSWHLLTTADPGLVAIENILKADVNNLADIIRVVESTNPALEKIYRIYENKIVNAIIHSNRAYEDLHEIGILHGDAAARNVLQDLRKPLSASSFVLCDFETCTPLGDTESDAEQILLEIMRYIGDAKQALDEAVADEQNLTDEQRQILQDSIDRVKAEVDKRV